MSWNPPRKLPVAGKFGRLYNWLNQLRDCVISLQPATSLHTITEHTSCGVIRRSKAQTTGTETTGLVPRGEYVSTETYYKNDLVVIYTGTTAGTYICVKDSPGASNPPVLYSDPNHGNYWMALPFASNIGQWT